MNLMSWHIVTSEEFRNGVKSSNSLYFLTDTHEIYRGEVPYTQSVAMYTNLPTAPAINRLYINSSTLEGKIYDGENWITVVKPVDDTISENGTNPVSSKAVIAYVASEITKAMASKDVVHSLTWDSAEHLLKVTNGDDSTQDIVFDGLGVSLHYTASTGVLTLLDAQGTSIGTEIKLDLERFVSSGEYDSENKTIVLYFDTDKTDYVTIPVGDLVDTYTAEGDGKALELTVEGNKVIGSIKISTAAGNTITADENGLYVAPTDISGKMDKDADATEGNIAVFDADGQAVDSGKNFDDIVPNNKVYSGATLDEAINGIQPIKGDIVIVRQQIGESDKYQRTVYQYDGESWKQFDENYNAENVYFAEDLITTAQIGNISLTNGQATIAAKGKNLKQVFESIFVKEKNPTTTQPTVKLTANQNKAYEVGTSVTPSFTASLNSGSYSYGPATGVIANSWTVEDTDGHTIAEASGSFDPIVVNDDTDYKITATASYDDGTIPVTNLGKEYATGQIKAGSVSATSDAITGFRRGFYGTLTEKGELTSDIIRALAGKTDAAPVAGDNWELVVPVGAMRAVFAYPASIEDVSSVIDTNGMKAEVKSSFTMSQMDIEGANNHSAIAYKVYVIDFANANDTENVFSITL